MNASAKSFDIFETCLLRSVGHPGSIFLLVARHAMRSGLLGSEAISFPSVRREAEIRVRSRSSQNETTLSDIYREVAQDVRYSDNVACSLMSIEINLENTLLKKNPHTAALISKHRIEGSHIIFKADSFFPAEFIFDLMNRTGFLKPGDKLCISGCNPTETTVPGELSKKPGIANGLREKTLTRTGNNWNILSSHRFQGASTHYEAGSLNRYESDLENWAVSTGGLTSVFAGASRLSRLTVQQGLPKASPLIDAAAGVLAPTLTAFVLWALRRAERLRLSRLYFLAREGQVLFIIAQKLVEKMNLSIDLRYLHVSRQSINLASISFLNKEQLSWVMTWANDNTIATILHRIGLEPSEIEKALESNGFVRESWNQPPEDEAAYNRLIDHVILGSAFEVARARISKVRGLAIKYLEQERVFADERIGLVDSTGAGSQLRTIGLLRRERQLPYPDSMLIYRRSPEKRIKPDASFPVQGWYDDDILKSGYGLPPGGAALMEMFCTADHGTVLGYKEAGKVVAPVLGMNRAEFLDRWGLPEIRCVVASFADHLHLDPDLSDLDADLRPAVRQILLMFWNHPTKIEAKAWGSYQLESSSGLDQQVFPFAAPLSLRDWLSALRSGRMRKRYWCDWLEGSLALSPFWVRLTLSSLATARAKLKRGLV